MAETSCTPVRNNSVARSKRRETWIVGGCFNHLRGAKVRGTGVRPVIRETRWRRSIHNVVGSYENGMRVFPSFTEYESALLCPFHREVEKQIGSCTLEFISVASYCRIKKHRIKLVYARPGWQTFSSIGSRPPFLRVANLPFFLSSLCPLYNLPDCVCFDVHRPPKRTFDISFNFPS